MDQDLDKQINALRLIIGAMAAGLIVFGTVTLAIGERMSDPGLAKLLLPVLAVLGTSEFIAYGVLRMATLNALRKDILSLAPAEVEIRALGTFCTLTLIRSAMAESFGLFGIVIVMVTGIKLVFAAPLLSLILLALGFPSRQKISDFIDTLTGRNPFAG